MYGIGIPHSLFTTDYIPYLIFDAKLSYKNKIIWKDKGYVVPIFDKGVPRYKLKQIMNDSRKLHEMWNKAAELIV